MAYDDQEQLEAIRAWWRQHGRTVILTVGVALAVVIGWQQWGAWQDRQMAEAASDYAAILESLNAGDREAAGNRLQVLREGHPDSPYAAMATLAVATAAFSADDAGSAADSLGWIPTNQPGSPLAVVARLRQAEALSAAGDDQSALMVLEPPPEGPLRPRYLELQGDLEAALGNTDAAIDAYRQALDETGGQRRSLLEIKLFELGGAPAS